MTGKNRYTTMIQRIGDLLPTYTQQSRLAPIYLRDTLAILPLTATTKLSDPRLNQTVAFLHLPGAIIEKEGDN